MADGRDRDGRFQGERGGFNNRGSPEGGGGARRDKPLVVGFRFLEALQKREPRDIVLTLSNPNTGLRAGLVDCVTKPDVLRLMINVLAKAFTCNSTPQQSNRIYIIIKECQFFDLSMDYFLDMMAEDNIHEQMKFRQPIKDMITIMEDISKKHPTSVTQFIGIHSVLRTVIDDLSVNTDVIDEVLLEAFREFSDDVNDRILHRGERVNACGGNQRSVPEVMKNWTDIKSKAKLAEQKRRGYMRKTGAGAPPAKLSSLDEKLVSVFPKEVLEGVAFGEDSFVPENSFVMTSVDPVEEEEVELAMSSTSEEDKENDAIDVSQVHKVRKRSKNSDDDCSELLVIEKQILQESRRRNDLLENIASKMDTIIDLKKKKLDLLERRYSSRF